MSERVRVYRNLHKSKPGRPVYSIMDLRTRRVVNHTVDIELKDVKFVVSQAGRARVLREKVKNVHAFVEGTIAAMTMETGEAVVYNPYKFASFVRRSDRAPVHSALRVRLGPGGLIMR